MPGQATVTIRDKQWSVSVANTYAELTSGLSGVESIPPQIGMLFDLGYDQSQIDIDMSEMLFPLDIIFINSTQGVVGVMHNVQPGETDVRLENETLPGARCFLEVNAGEAEGIEVGDDVAIQGYAQPTQLDISSLMNFMLIMVFVVMMFKMVDRALGEPKERLRMLGGAKLPPGYKPVHHSSGGISERKLQELIDEVADVDDPDRICYWVEADDEMVYLEGWCDKCLIGTGFPTIEAGNHEEKIDYIKDITKETLKRKAKERGLRLIRGGFVETIGPPYYTANLYGVSYGIYQKTEEPHSDGEGNQRGFWLGIAGAERKFPLGQIVMTRGVNDLVAKSAEFSQFVVESFRHHASGDWGDLSPEDKRENELALKVGNLRLFSAYTKPGLPKIWIITEADRSATTILFPEEY